jgi:aspartate/methionine/tyrosine aminotransferase
VVFDEGSGLVRLRPLGPQGRMNDRRGVALSPRLGAAARATRRSTGSRSTSPRSRRRDLLSAALTGASFAVVPPEGTFYLFARWPEGDPEALWNSLAGRDAFVLPGSLMDASDHLRLTASDAMVDRALPVFAGLRVQA